MAIFSSLYGTRLDRELGSADSTQLFTTARRKSAINEGIQEFAKLTRCLQRRIGIGWAHGDQIVNLNSTTYVQDGDFFELSSTPLEFRYTDTSGQMQVLTGDDLPHRSQLWLNRYEPGWQNSSATDTGVKQLPHVYFTQEGQGRFLGLWPPPGQGSTGDAMLVILYYVGLPPTLTSDTQEPFTPTGALSTLGGAVSPVYHQAAVHYAAHQLEKLRRDHEASQAQFQMFMGYVTQFLTGLRRKGGNTLTFARRYFRTSRSEIVTDPRT